MTNKMPNKMTNKMPNAAPSAAHNAAEVWKQMEDSLVPRLRLSVLDRSVYSYLLRYTRLEGKSRLHFSIQWLARGIGLSAGPAREALRRLLALGALRLVQRNRNGHLVEVLLPAEIPARREPAAFPGRTRTRFSISTPLPFPIGRTQARALHLDGIDFLQTRALRQSIHTRERGRCFYCLRRLTQAEKCLDHVVPRARFGRNSYRNLVSSCVQCNSQKGARPVGDLLRWLYRERSLTAVELKARLRALNALAAGKLRPLIPSVGTGALPAPVHPASRKQSCRGALPWPELRRQRVPTPPGGPANPVPRRGRHTGSRRLPQIS
ncbi:MAG TPA: HNH endonuclease [Candidatus Cybelea sp.]|nr:HNH endonuclease [Candidatus Cybelea sp.]